MQHGKRKVAAAAMSVDAARKQRWKAAARNMKKRILQSAAEAGAAAMGDMATGELQGAAEAGAAATGEMVTRGLRSTAGGEGSVAMGTMTSNVSVARAATEEDVVGEAPAEEDRPWTMALEDVWAPGGGSGGSSWHAGVRS